jgi:hypothetical protein
MVALDYGGWSWDTQFNEISRPCLRRLELEVEISIEDHDDDWFARGTSEHALQAIALDGDDYYVPDATPLATSRIAHRLLDLLLQACIPSAEPRYQL